jgi:hypothetical protein
VSIDVKQNEPAGCLLAPLDFDMAFTKKSFNKFKDGVVDESLLNEWMNMECKAMKMALGGDDRLNTGVTGTTELNSTYTVLKWALR